MVEVYDLIKSKKLPNKNTLELWTSYDSVGKFNTYIFERNISGKIVKEHYQTSKVPKEWKEGKSTKKDEWNMFKNRFNRIFKSLSKRGKI